MSVERFISKLTRVYIFLFLFLFVSLSAASFVHASLVVNKIPADRFNKGLVGYWSFDGSTIRNNISDVSGNSHTGYLRNVATSTAEIPGKIGQALNFDGVNDFVDVPSTSGLNIGNNFTISVWINKRSNNTDDGIFDNGDYYLATLSGGQIRFTTSSVLDYTFSSTFKPRVGKWEHIVIVFDSGNDANLYMNGVFKETQLGTSPSGTAVNTGSIGVTNDIGGSEFNGSIDELRVYNRVLSAAEIQGLYIAGQTVVNKTETRINDGLLGYWSFDGKTIINNVKDLSGQGNNGYMVGFGATSSAATSGKSGQALVFNGNNSYVNVGSSASLALTSNMSIFAWIKLTKIPNSNKYIFSRRDPADNGKGYALYVDPASNLNGVVRNDSTFENHPNLAALRPGVWYHVGMTSDGTTMKVYVNNSSQSYTSLSAKAVSASGIIGIYNDLSSVFDFPGAIDELRIYNRVLSPSEVQTLYNLGIETVNKTNTSRINSGLIGYWTFDGKDFINNVADLSGQGNTGYVRPVTATSSVKVTGKIGQGVKFNGTSQYVNLGTMGTFSSNLDTVTVSMWVKSTSDELAVLLGTLGSLGQFLRLSINANMAFSKTKGALQYFVRSNNDLYGAVNSNTGITDGRWHHLVVMHNKPAATISIYIDGVSKTISYGTASNGTTWTAWTQPLILGAFYDQGPVDSFYEGMMDDVRIYNRLLSVAEIKQLYNIGR